jgi:hypothetical protein
MVDVPFPVPARQTVHAVLPHTAYRRSSPAAFDFPGPQRPGRDDDPIETDRAQVIRGQQHLGHAPTPRPSAVAPFRQPQRQPTQSEVPDLAEQQSRVPVAEIPRPTAEEQVELPHDLLDRHQQPGPGGDRPDPIPGVPDRLACGPAGKEGQMRRAGSPPAHQPVVEPRKSSPSPPSTRCTMRVIDRIRSRACRTALRASSVWGSQRPEECGGTGRPGSGS